MDDEVKEISGSQYTGPCRWGLVRWKHIRESEEGIE